MKLEAVLFGILVVSFALIFTLAVPASDVHADDGGCTAYIGGEDVTDYNSPGNALQVPYDESLEVSFIAPDFIERHQITMAFTDIAPWTVSDEEDDSDKMLYMHTVEVADYADYGVGIYKVKGTAWLANGDTCSATVYIKVVGKSWVGTWAGGIALGVFVLGFGLLLFRFITLFRSTSPRGWISLGLLLPVLPLAVLTTSGDSQTTGFEDVPQAPSSSKDASGDSKNFRLKISIVSILGALLAAIGLVVMLQQMGTVYPTITIVVLSLVLALVAGIVLPTLAQTFSRRK